MFPNCSVNDYMSVITREAPFLLGPNRKPILKRPQEETLEERIQRFEAKKAAHQNRGDTAEGQ